MRRKLFYMLIPLLAGSCAKQAPETIPGDGQASVTFSVILPDPVPVQTRAPWSDTDIDNIDLLVFDENGLFMERVDAYNITGTGNVKNFAARLDLSDKPRTIHIVANGRRTDDTDRINFYALSSSMPQTTAIPALQTIPITAATAAADIMPLVMWGRVNVSAISSSVTINGYKLIRVQACIRMQTAAPDAANGLDKFTLTSFSVNKATSHGKLTPADYSSSATVPASPNAAGIPDINYYTDGTSGYWAAAASPVLYLYERANSSTNYTSLIIKGSYDGQEGYYKVVMVDNAGSPVNIVRNHRYIVTIVKAFGAGFPTLQLALDNAPSNALKVEITDAKDAIPIIVADGQNELGISNNTVILQGNPSNTSVDIASVFATRSSALSVSSTVTGLAGLQFSAADGDGIRKLTGTWTGSSGSGTITVTDGSLKLAINVQIKSFTSDSPSQINGLYVYSLMGSPNSPWQVEINPGSQYIWLHPSATQASAYPGGLAGNWGSTLLESRSVSSCYLYLHQTAAVSGSVRYSRQTAGNQEIARMIFNR